MHLHTCNSTLQSTYKHTPYEHMEKPQSTAPLEVAPARLPLMLSTKTKAWTLLLASNLCRTQGQLMQGRWQAP